MAADSTRRSKYAGLLIVATKLDEHEANLLLDRLIQDVERKGELPA
jgi:hypothetical protein